MHKNDQLSRRKFLKSAVSAAFATSIIPASAWSQQNNNVLPGNRLTLGFIGVGIQGSGLLRGFLNDANFQVAAVCDVDENKLNRARNNVEKFYADKQNNSTYTGCGATRDFREIINRADIDAIVIATPDHWHAIPSIMAMQAGKDVYCEKPLTLTIAEGRAMVNTARRYERIFQTGSMQRSDQKFRFACELVRNGYIGDIKSVRVSIRTGFIPHPQICELAAENVLPELDWNLWLGPAPERPYNSIIAPPISFNGFPAWRNYRDYSGGGMTDWGAHHFDIAQWGLGMDSSGPVEIIPPDGKNYPLLTYRYANGIEMTTDFLDNYILFTGAKGTIKVNRTYLLTDPASLATLRIATGDIHLDKSVDHKQNWLQSIKTRSKPITDVEIGHRSVSVCHLGNLAVQLGRKLQWNPDKEQFVNDTEANRLLTRAKRSPWNI